MKITGKKRKAKILPCGLTYMGKREDKDVWIISIPEENISGSPGPEVSMELNYYGHRILSIHFMRLH